MPPPGATAIASQSPEGDHSTELTGSSSADTRVGQPPSVGAVQTWGMPFRSHVKANVFPSGEKVGDPHWPTRAIKVTAFVNSSVVEGEFAVTTFKAENRAMAIKSVRVTRMRDLRYEKRVRSKAAR